MSTRNLDRIFNPQRIAVIGASDNPTGVGAPVLRNLLSSGFGGVIYPVNPKREAVQGVPAYPQVAALPHTPDLAIICTPAPTVPGLIRECGEAGIEGVVVLSAGFREAGPEGRALEAQLREAAQRFPGMRLIGPNCLGVIVPPLHLNASFASGMPPAGHVAFLSQSGALGTAVLDWAAEEEIGFSAFVSLGNMAETGFGDLIDYFGQDPNTHSIILYVESVTQARQFMSAARAFSRTKPIVAYKAGRFAESARAAISHTGAMVGEDAVYTAAFQRAGIERVYDFEELFDCAELLGRQRLPLGGRLAILTNAGGPGIMATDALMACRGTLAQLSDHTLHELDAILPAAWPRANPVDILGDAPAERFGAAARLVLADPGIDALLVLLSPQAMTDPTAAAQAVAGAAVTSRKPVLASWLGGRSVREGIRVLNHAGIATYSTPEQAVSAFMHLVSYARNQETLYEAPRELPAATDGERERVRELLSSPSTAAGVVLPEATSKAVLEAYGIPVTRTLIAGCEQEAVEAAEGLGYPVVLKVVSPQITHKTDVGGVVLNVEHEAGVREGFRRIEAAVRRQRPEARFDGVSVQRMIAEAGVELILGARKDPVLGAVIMVGLGGVTAELLQDRALGLPPLNERLARQMLESLRAWPLLQGYRGRPGVDLDRLTEVLVRFSYLIANHPEIAELDVNPLRATPAEVIALDARVILDREALEHPVEPYSHLAIRPVPDDQRRSVGLLNGTRVTLRPIRPEDEARWQEMLAACSPQTLHARFQSTTSSANHQVASRYCFIDYD
ncbi:MAG: bifunctional acyl-CoA synthetase/GNAT family N-acetyltransferase, partial [Armatimonadetes bacterium]|nr:bifunctional acyl-CoA synthetase/GNAT family N-acetyltransferase [Armatimonadota bacterium]